MFHLKFTGDVVDTYHWDVLMTYQRDFAGCFIWDLLETSWRRTGNTLLLRPLETSSRRTKKMSWRRTTETSQWRSIETSLGVSFETYLRRHWDVQRDVVTTSPRRLVAGWALSKSISITLGSSSSMNNKCSYSKKGFWIIHLFLRLGKVNCKCMMSWNELNFLNNLVY